jgi:probable phosphoglycerate mutase
VSSPLVRARETMEIMRREIGLPPGGYRTDDRLREISYGHWEGELWGELSVRGPARLCRARSRQDGAGSRGVARATGRCRSVWRLGSADRRRDVVVAAHGGVMRVLRGLCGELGPAEIFALDVPQDKVLVIECGRTRWL